MPEGEERPRHLPRVRSPPLSTARARTATHPPLRVVLLRVAHVGRVLATGLGERGPSPELQLHPRPPPLLLLLLPLPVPPPPPSRAVSRRSGKWRLRSACARHRGGAGPASARLSQRRRRRRDSERGRHKLRGGPSAHAQPPPHGGRGAALGASRGKSVWVSELQVLLFPFKLKPVISF